MNKPRQCSIFNGHSIKYFAKICSAQWIIFLYDYIQIKGRKMNYFGFFFCPKRENICVTWAEIKMSLTIEFLSHCLLVLTSCHFNFYYNLMFEWTINLGDITRASRQKNWIAQLLDANTTRKQQILKIDCLWPLFIRISALDFACVFVFWYSAQITW